MWAQICLIDNGRNNIQIVPLKNILNFDVKRLRTKLFNVEIGKNNIKNCRVLTIADTRQQLDIKIKTKRPVITSSKSLASASELSNSGDTEVNTVEEEKFCNSQQAIQKNLLKHLEDNKNIVKASSEKDIKLQEELRNVQMENDVLKKQNVELEKKIKTLEENTVLFKEVQALNISWQKTALNNWERFKEILNEKQAPSVPEESTEKLPVGYISEDGKDIHLGRNVWLPLCTYTYAVSGVDSVSIITRNLASAVFGDNVLITSTLSGKFSNRTKKGNQKQLYRLDPIKILAIKDIVRYYLTNDLGKSEAEVDESIDSIRTYIAKKIADLKEKTKKNSTQ